MRLAALLTLLALGCSPPPPAAPTGPQFRYVGTGLDQEHYPLAFALKITNEGDTPAVVDDVRFNVPYKMILYDDDAGEAPSGFDCVVQVLTDLPGTSNLPATIAPGETVDIAGLVTWTVPADAPPMLAIVRARFQTLLKGEATIDQEPLIMFLQSRPGALDAVMEGTTTRSEYNQLLKALRDLDGEQSVGFRELIQRIEAEKENEI